VNEIIGIDISRKMIDIAKNKAKVVENIVFYTSTLEEFNAKAESFDAVLALSVLHLLDNRTETIESVYQILKPGGVFVTSTVCM